MSDQRRYFEDDELRQRRGNDERTGRYPYGEQRSDDRIREDLSDRLTDDPAIDASEVTNHVRVNRGEASRGHATGSSTLSGTGPTTQGPSSQHTQKRTATP